MIYSNLVISGMLVAIFAREYPEVPLAYIIGGVILGTMLDVIIHLNRRN
jgi:hypothetical protein